MLNQSDTNYFCQIPMGSFRFSHLTSFFWHEKFSFKGHGGPTWRWDLPTRSWGWPRTSRRTPTPIRWTWGWGPTAMTRVNPLSFHRSEWLKARSWTAWWTRSTPKLVVNPFMAPYPLIWVSLVKFPIQKSCETSMNYFLLPTISRNFLHENKFVYYFDMLQFHEFFKLFQLLVKATQLSLKAEM